jgi:hypothetical protein
MAGGYAKILSGFVGFRTRDEVFYILVSLNYKSIIKTGMGRGFLHISIIKLRKYPPPPLKNFNFWSTLKILRKENTKKCTKVHFQVKIYIIFFPNLN